MTHFINLYLFGTAWILVKHYPNAGEFLNQFGRQGRVQVLKAILWCKFESSRKENLPKHDLVISNHPSFWRLFVHRSSKMVQLILSKKTNLEHCYVAKLRGQVTSCLGWFHAGFASGQIATPIQAGTPKMEVGKVICLFNQVIFGCHVSFGGSNMPIAYVRLCVQRAKLFWVGWWGCNLR